MAIRQIAKIGEPVLRKKAKVVTKFDDKLVELLEDMADTMYEADGVGLAAPQVSILKRVVVIDIGEGLLELINPGNNSNSWRTNRCRRLFKYSR